MGIIDKQITLQRNIRFYLVALIMAVLVPFSVAVGSSGTNDPDWGVLAFNADQDVYRPGETAVIHIGVLDTEGVPTCDAAPTMTVNGEDISVNDAGLCKVFDSANTLPDYAAQYTFDSPGEYEVAVSVDNGSGLKTITDTITVEDNPQLVVDRRAATRLYPFNESDAPDSPMKIGVEFSGDFAGTITETIPEGFAVADVSNDGVFDAGNRTISWDVSAQAAERVELSYTYDAPDVSPALYEVGELRATDEDGTTHTEQRQWHIANDKLVALGADTRAIQYGADADANDNLIGPDIAYSETSDVYLVVAAGRDNAVDGTDNDVYGSIVDKDGAPIGSKFLINNSDTDAQESIFVEWNSTDNEFFVVWYNNTNYDIQARRVSTSGTLLGSQTTIYNSSSQARYISLEYNATDNEFLVTHGRYSGVPQLYAIRVNNTGSAITSSIIVNGTSPGGGSVGPSYENDVVWNSTNNEYLVTYNHYNNPAPSAPNESNVYGVIISNTLAVQHGPTDISVNNVIDGTNDSHRAAYMSAAHNSADNEFLVTWRGEIADENYEFVGQLVDENLSLIGTDFQISDTTSSGTTTFPQRTENSAFNFAFQGGNTSYDSQSNQYIATWQGDDVAGDQEVYAQLITAAGVETGPDDLKLTDIGEDTSNLNADAGFTAITDTFSAQTLVAYSADDSDFGLSDNEADVFTRKISIACVWTNGNSTGIWNDPLNWDFCSNLVPGVNGGFGDGTGRVALFNSTSTDNSTIDVAVTDLALLLVDVAYTGTIDGATNDLNFTTGGIEMDNGTINLGDGTWDVNGDIDFTGGTINGNAGTVNLQGNWTNSSGAGALVPGTSTFVLDPSVDHTLSGDTNFYSLTATDDSDDSTTTSLFIGDGNTMTFASGGTLTLTGQDAVDDQLIVTTTGSTTPANFVMQDDEGHSLTASNLTISYNNLQDSGMTDWEPEKDPVGSTDAGTTTGWFDDEDVRITYGSLGRYDFDNISYTQDAYDSSGDSNVIYGSLYNNDGTRFYGTDNSGTIVQYTLSSAYDMSTASYDGVVLNVTSQDTQPFDAIYNGDGTRLYILGNQGKDITRYDLSTPYDVSTGTPHSVALSGLSAYFGGLGELLYNNDGTKLYVTGISPQRVVEFNLGTPYDIATASHSHTLEVFPHVSGALASVFNDDGTELYVGNSGTNIEQFNLSTPYSLSTATHDSTVLASSNTPGSLYTMFHNGDGSKFYAVIDDVFEEYNLVDPGGFTEAVANDGTIDASSGLIFTLYDDTFNDPDTDGELTVCGGAVACTGQQVQVNNIPAQFTPTINLYDIDGTTSNTTDTGVVGILTLTGAATDHQDIHDVADLTFVFDDSAFNTTAAASVTNATGPASSGAGIDFEDNGWAITYAAAGGHDVANATYTASVLNTSADIGTPYEMMFNNDGTSLYVLDWLNDDISEYTLTTPYDPSTGTFSSTVLNFSAQEPQGLGMRYNDDGSRLYLTGFNSTVYQYNMSTNYDISTATFNSVALNGAAQISQVSGLLYNADGTAMYLLDRNIRDVEAYTLSTPYDVSTATHAANVPLAVPSAASAFRYNHDGTKLFVMSDQTHDIYEYSLSTPYDITTFSGLTTVLDTTPDASMFAFEFNNDGTKLFTINSGTTTVHEYALGVANGFTESTPANDGTLTAGNQLAFTLTADTFNDPDTDGELTVCGGAVACAGHQVQVNNIPAQFTPTVNLYDIDGTTSNTTDTGVVGILTLTGAATDHQDIHDVADLTFVFDDSAFNTTAAASVTNATGPASSGAGIDFADNGWEVTYSGAGEYDVENAGSATQVLDTSLDFVETGYGALFNADGSVLYVIDINTDQVRRYNLTTNYDLTTATYQGIVLTAAFTNSNDVTAAQGMAFNNDGTKLYIIDSDDDEVVEYDLSTPYDISDANATYSFSLGVGGFEVNPLKVLFNADGTQVNVLGLGAGGHVTRYNLATPYSLATASGGAVIYAISENASPTAFQFNTNGSELYIGGQTPQMIHKYTLSTNYDISTATYSGFDLDNGGLPVADIFYDNLGSNLHVLNTNRTVTRHQITGLGFTESDPANDGTVTGNISATLANDTYNDPDTDGELTVCGGAVACAGHQVQVNNIPAQFTPTINLYDADGTTPNTSDSGVVAILTLTGAASAHQDADDIADLTFVFDDSAFNTAPASSVTNATGPASSGGGIDYLDNSGISGTVYTDEGTTNIGAGKTVRLLVNGADSGITTTTSASGFYVLTTPIYSIGDVLTVYLDDEAENGVTVTIGATANGDISGLDIYQDYLRASHENAGPLTDTHLGTADDADPGTSSDDISSVYSFSGATLTTPASTEMLVVSGKTYQTANASDFEGSLDVNGTFDAGANAINLAGDLDVDNAGTLTHTGTLTFDGAAGQSYNQGDDAIGSDVGIANTVAPVTVSNNDLDIGANDLTISASATLTLAGNSATATGTFSNDGTLQFNGDEVAVMVTQDTDSGTWELVDDGDNAAEVIDVDGTRYPSTYYNLIINSDDAQAFDRDGLRITTGSLIVNNDLTVTAGSLNGNDQTVTVGNDLQVDEIYEGGSAANDFNGNVVINAAGSMTATSAATTVSGNWTNAGAFTHNSGSVTLDPDVNHNLVGSTTFNDFTFQVTSSDDDGGHTLTVDNTATIVFQGALALDGLDADDELIIVSDSASNEADFRFDNTGASSSIGDFLNVTDNNIDNINGATISLPINPASSTDGGNAANWFGTVIVEFSNDSASSTDESAADNYPTLFVFGTIVAATTIDLDITGGTAANSGTDYTQADPFTINIPAGSYDGTSGTAITITAPTLNDDAIIEGNETISYGLINPGVNVSVGDADSSTVTESTHTYTITDDDQLLVEFTNTADSAAEATASPTFTLSVSGADTTTTGPDTVDVDITGGTATGGGTDYTLADPVTVTIPAGDYTTPQTIGVGLALNDDGILEGDETITMALNNPTGDATIGDADGADGVETTNTFTITDDETATIEFASTTSSTVDESTAVTIDAQIDLTATTGTPSIAAGQTITVDSTFNTGSSGATNGPSDDIEYNLPGGVQSFTFTDATSDLDTQSLTYTLNDDSAIEGVETAVFDLAFAGAGTLNAIPQTSIGANNSHTLSITDDDGLGVVFSNAVDSAAEASGTPTYTITVSGADSSSSGAETIDVQINGGGTASGGGTDYTYTSGTTINIPAADYTTPVTFPVGLVLDDDNLLEGDETINFELVNPSSGNLIIGTQNTNTFTITDDETATVEFSATTSNTGGDEDGATTVSGELTLTSTTGTPAIASGETITVEVAYNTGSTATNGASQDIDFTSPETLTFTDADATGATKNLSFTLTDDSVVEGNESAVFDMTLAGTGSLNSISQVALGGDLQHTMTIDDDDGLSVQFSSATDSALEASGVSAIELEVAGGVSVVSQTVEIDITSGTANGSGADYSLTGPTVFTIPAGNYSSATVLTQNITLSDDNLLEGDETIDLALINPSANIAVGAQSTSIFTITEDETATVQFANSTSGTGGDEDGVVSPNPQVALTLTSTTGTPAIDTGKTITFDATYSLSSTATNGAGQDIDFTSPESLSFTDADANGATRNLTFALNDDSTVENDETAIFDLGNIGGTAPASIGAASTHTLTISDDDTLTVQFQNATDSSAEATGAPAQLLVSGAEITSPSTVDVTVTGGTATGSGTDYSHTVTTTIPASDYSTPGMVAVDTTVIDDGIFEGDETITYSLSNPVDATLGTQTSNTYTITDDETYNVQFQSAASSTGGDEDATVSSILVELVVNATTGSGTLDTGDIVRVDITDSGTGTSSTPSEYTFSAQTIEFTSADGNGTTKQVSLDLSDDRIDEVDETVILGMTANMSGTMTPPLGVNTSHTLTVNDDDTPGITVIPSSLNTNEAGSSATYSVVLDSEPHEGGTTVVIDLALDNGQSTVNTNQLTFTNLNWFVPQVVEVSPVDDTAVEGTHTTTVSHTINVAGTTDTTYAALTGLTSVTNVIADDDSPSVLLSKSTVLISEDGTTDSYTVRLTTQPQASSIVRVTVSPDSQTDLGAGVGTAIDLDFSDSTWSIPQVVTVTADDDAIEEANPHLATIAHAIDTGVTTDTDYDALTAVGSVTPVITDNDGDTDGDGIPDILDDDDDGDGVDDALEDTALNNDGNGDGIVDRIQSHVASNVNDVTGSYTTLEISGCVVINGFTVVDETTLTLQDPDAVYPVGLNDFQLQCINPGDTATVTLLYDQVYDTTDWLYKKFDDIGNEYSDLTGSVTFGTRTIASGVEVTTATYSVTDGGSYDTDGTANAVIDDPAGPAVPISASDDTDNSLLIETGIAVVQTMLVGVALATVAVAIKRRTRSREDRA